MIHAMIDVEALRLSKPWLAPLMQVGILTFDGMAKPLCGYEFTVDQNSLPEWAEPEQSTVEWWKSQPMWPRLKEAEMLGGGSIEECLDFICEIYVDDNCSTVWFAGPQYDLVILQAYFEHFGKKMPWRHNDVRDFRTIRKQHSVILEGFPDSPNQHLALADCYHQVERLKLISNSTGISWM